MGDNFWDLLLRLCWLISSSHGPESVTFSTKRFFGFVDFLGRLIFVVT